MWWTSVPAPGKPGIVHPPQPGEAARGRELAAALIRRHGLHRDPALLRYANLVGMAVALHSDRPELPYAVGILDTGEVRTFSVPGGYLFITRGMLEALGDEAELAGVLAHAVAHVARGHTRGMTFKRLLEGFSLAQEQEADRLATLYLRRVGYDPRGLRDALRRLRSLPAARGQRIPSRLESLEGFLFRTGLGLAQGARLPERFRRYAGKP